MTEPSPVDLSYSKRYGVLAAQHSIQTVWDLVVELMTNADESYGRLYRAGTIAHDGGQILIEIDPSRKNGATIRVSDRAQGIADLDAVIRQVGVRTSQEGDRGFMGRGLKDCASLGAVTVETIHDGVLSLGEITEHFKYQAHRPVKASELDRHRLSIPHNGTSVTVRLNPSVTVPRQETMAVRLPWHFALRDILSPSYPGRVLLRYGDGKTVQICSDLPSGELVHAEEYVVPGYEGIRARFELHRAQEPIEDLGAGPKFNRSGIVVKGVRGIYECSFLRDDFSRDPAADKYFGRLVCAGIEQLAREWDNRREREESHPPTNPTLLIDPNRREGLVREHPFVAALFERPIEVLGLQLEQEREKSRKQRVEVEAKETTERLKRLAREASRFMREKLEDFDAVGADVDVKDSSFAERGIRLVPPFCQIALGDERRFCVKVHPKLGLPAGTEVRPILGKHSSEALEHVGDTVDLELDPSQEGVLRGFFTLRAISAVGRVQVGCAVDGLDPVFVDVETVDVLPKDIEVPNGFAFSRATYSVGQGRRRTLRLHAQLEGTPLAGQLPTVKLNRQDVIVRSITPFEPVPGTTYEESRIEVEGKKLQGHADILAQLDGHSATAQLSVKDKPEEGVELEFKIVNYELGKHYRAVWDRLKPNTLLISARHESVSRYLGREEEGYPGQHHGPFRVLLAELISDNICRRIVEEHLKGTAQKTDVNYVYTMHNRLMKEFTPIAHKVQLSNPGQYTSDQLTTSSAQPARRDGGDEGGQPSLFASN